MIEVPSGLKGTYAVIGEVWAMHLGRRICRNVLGIRCFMFWQEPRLNHSGEVVMWVLAHRECVDW